MKVPGKRKGTRDLPPEEKFKKERIIPFDSGYVVAPSFFFLANPRFLNHGY
jgi:hypothetical protein